MTRPDQERIGRVRGALIAVATSFDDEAQIVSRAKFTAAAMSSAFLAATA